MTTVSGGEPAPNLGNQQDASSRNLENPPPANRFSVCLFVWTCGQERGCEEHNQTQKHTNQKHLRSIGGAGETRTNTKAKRRGIDTTTQQKHRQHIAQQQLAQQQQKLSHDVVIIVDNCTFLQIYLSIIRGVAAAAGSCPAGGEQREA